MADYFTLFSCLFDVGTPENAARALDLYANPPEDRDEPDSDFESGFRLSLQADGVSELGIRDDGYGSINAVIDFVRLCARTFGLKGRWGFEWANTCSKLRLDAFGGGAIVIDLATGGVAESVDTTAWISDTLQGGADA